MKKRVVFLSFIAVVMLFTLKVKAATFKDNQVVQATKVWNIHFNQEVSFDDLSKQGIIVVDSSGNKVNITLSLGNDNKTIVVNPPVDGYKGGNTYKLIIANTVHSKRNISIKQQIAMNFSIENNSEDEIVTFKDANLEKVVRDALNKPNGTIYKKDVEKITSLEVDQKNITYLDGIENFINLEDFSAIKNDIKDITPLKKLTNLKWIYLDENKIDSVDPLADLVNLKGLSMKKNNLVDISGLKRLTELRTLYLDNNEINDINPLRNLYNLIALSVNENKINYIESLGGLQNLEDLSLSGNCISNIEVLTQLNSLKYLTLEGNFIGNIDCLKNVKNLRAVDGFLISDLDKYFKLYYKAKEIIESSIKPNMSDLEKEKAIHDYVILNTRFDYGNYSKNAAPPDDYNAYGILINATGVCEGYAETTKLLLNMAGINCIVVSGQANNGTWESHAWNIVQIDGKYYQLDTTWDDSVPDRAGYVSYNYFNISDDELSKDHKWSDDYPKCE